MKLYLTQHGAALPEELDPDRPLSEQGRLNVERLASFLGRAGVRVSRKAAALLLTGAGNRGAGGFRPGGLACLEREGLGPWTLTGMPHPDWLIP